MLSDGKAVDSIPDRKNETFQGLAAAFARRACEILERLCGHGRCLAAPRSGRRQLLLQRSELFSQRPRLLRERSLDLLEGNRRGEQDEGEEA